MSSQTGLLSSFLAALQASLSVLLVISYGALAAYLKLLDSPSSKKISKISVKFFLPALLLTQIGSELHTGHAIPYLIILGWAFLCHFVSFLIGVAAHWGLGMPDWITAALMFNNTTSYPLLLIQSLDQTGILNSLIEDEGTKAGIERAKSYFLVFATVSSCLTFAVGPRLMEGEHAPEPSESDKNSLAEDEEEEENGTEPRGEETLLLPPSERGRHASVASVSFFPSALRESNPAPKPIHATQRRPSTLLISKRKWYELSERTQWWLLFFYDFLNAPLIGAVLGAIIGFVPALHKAFFADSEDGGIFTAWLTASLQNLGSLFVPLPVVIAGVSLYLSAQKKPSSSSSEGARPSTPWATTLFVLFIRFVLWPIVSIAIIYGAGKAGWLGDDKMFWFALMLMPTGPPAMKLITMVEVSDASEEDEHKIAQLLTISYVVSPVLAFTVVGSLRACVAAAS